MEASFGCCAPYRDRVELNTSHSRFCIGEVLCSISMGKSSLINERILFKVTLADPRFFSTCYRIVVFHQMIHRYIWRNLPFNAHALDYWGWGFSSRSHFLLCVKVSYSVFDIFIWIFHFSKNGEIRMMKFTLPCWIFPCGSGKEGCIIREYGSQSYRFLGCVALESLNFWE